MVKGWGRLDNFNHDIDHPYYLSDVNLTTPSTDQYITLFGQGRSYGDVALNDAGRIIKTQALNRFISIDLTKGILRAESGITLDTILRTIVPQGWFLPVTPGTKFVSLGGAVANDVHGKNHHKVGSIGAFVKKIGLYRSDGQYLELSKRKNTALFNLTISGLGLTGFIAWVELQLLPIRSSQMDVENITYNNLDAFYELSEQSKDWDYAVAWVDCFSSGRALGRGIFTRARHVSEDGDLTPHKAKSALNWPVRTPSMFLNKYSISAFNALYRNRLGARFAGHQHYDGFFYPLDHISNWNRLYGRNGFYQHQCIIPKQHAHEAMRELLETIIRFKQGSFLAVMKNHGPELSPGRNSFPLEGTSLALDFANKGEKTLDLLHRLDEIVLKFNGRVYPAKDASMSASTYQTCYPNWTELEAHRDPNINSAFWQRVTGKPNE